MLRPAHLCHAPAQRVEAIIETDGRPAAGVLLAAHGVGAPVCEETPVVRGDAAAAHCWALLQKRGGPGAICIDDAGACLVRAATRREGEGGVTASAVEGAAPAHCQPRAHPRRARRLPLPLPRLTQPAPPPPPAALAWQADGEPLPQDFRALHLRAGLTSFLSVLVSAGTRVIGSLTIAARAPGAFSEAWWQPVLTMSAAALLPHLRNRQLVSLCRMMVAVDAEQDAAEAASHVIYVSGRRAGSKACRRAGGRGGVTRYA